MFRLPLMITFSVVLVVLQGSCSKKGVSPLDVPSGKMTVDGSRDDWTYIVPIANDPEGDDQSTFTGADAKGLYVAQDTSGMIYVMIDFWDGSPNPEMASGVTKDGDETHPDEKMGYQVFFDDRAIKDIRLHPKWELFGRYDTLAAEWFIWVPGDWAIDNAVVAGGEVLEFSFPHSEIGYSSPVHIKAHVNTSAHSERREMIPDSEGWVTIRFGP